MKILGIETSCDETAVGLVEERKILSNVVASQAQIHAPFGGVVPEIASRHHVETLPFVLEKSLQEASLSLKDIDGIAATYTPGLLGALLVGLQFGKALAFALKKPFVGVNHLEGHLNAVFLAPPPVSGLKARFAGETGGGVENEAMEYPYLGMIVSGGHTHLYLVKEFGCYQKLGATLDDACGEAFDKVAKLLGLGYPGGPLIEKAARLGNPKAFRLTKPKLGENSLDFSFSGVKTACLLQVKRQNGDLSQNFIQDLAASFQDMVTDFLVERLAQAASCHCLKTIVVTGGVAANQTLKKKLELLAAEHGYHLGIPSIPLCTDNGAMIAYTGGIYLKRNQTSPFSLNALASSELT